MPLHRWFLAGVLCACVLAGSAAAQPADPTQAGPSAQTDDLRTRLRLLSPMQRDEVLWLARCVYSESDHAHEQRLVAWVVRNRVETGFRGTTYREVVLEPQQFSAFNVPSIRRTQILNFDENSASAGWRQALKVAMEIYQAPANQRPFAVTTRHFYSPVSMEGGRTPDWAQGAQPLALNTLGIDPYRFRFFDNLDEGQDPALVQPDRPIKKTWAVSAGASTRRTSLSQLRNPGFSGRVKRPVRPYLDRPSRR